MNKKLPGSKSSYLWSPIVRYTVASAINLAILIIGIGIGVFFVPHIIKTANAAGQTANTQQPSATPTPPANAAPDPCANAECVTPGVGLGGPVATNTLLANRIACDAIQVNGFDVLKLDDAFFSLLQRKGIATPADISAIVSAGKVARPLRLRPNQ